MKSEKGQATVELALSLTILVFFIFAIIDFGRIFHSYLSIEHASREAARIASLGATDSEVVQIAKQSAPSLNSNDLGITISPSIRTRGTYVTIHTTYPVSISIPLLQNVLPDPLVIKGKTVMRVE